MPVATLWPWWRRGGAKGMVFELVVQLVVELVVGTGAGAAGYSTG